MLHNKPLSQRKKQKRAGGRAQWGESLPFIRVRKRGSRKWGGEETRGVERGGEKEERKEKKRRNRRIKEEEEGW